MAELLEYSLVVMVSMLFVAGSVMVYGGFTTFESGLSNRAAFESVSGLVATAIAHGNATASVATPSSSIACQGGTLSMTVGGSTLNESIPLGCAFDVSVPAGVHVLRFSDGSGGLELSVS